MMENQISIEEMKAAVLAECERLCPNMNEVSHQPMFTLVNRPVEQGASEYTNRVWEFIHPNFTFLIYAESPFIPMAYRLLGLEAKAKDAEIQRMSAALGSTQQHAENVREEWGGVDDDLDSDLAGIAETARTALKGGTND
jgi:hypothetical protein